MRKRATIVWHTNESCSGGYLVISDQDMDDDFLAENILDAEFEPEIGEFIDSDNLCSVKVVRDGEVEDIPVSALLRAYDKDRFAAMGWHPGDVLAHRPEWTEQQARAWLQQNSSKFQVVLSERGNEVLGAMLPKEPLPKIICIFAVNSNGYGIEIRQGEKRLSSWSCPVAMIGDEPVRDAVSIRQVAEQHAAKCAKDWNAEEIVERECVFFRR